MSNPRAPRLGAAAALAALITVPALLGCEGDRAGAVLGSSEALVSCSVARGTVAAGSTVPVQVTVFVTRGGVGSNGERVQFETDRGDVTPDAVFTNSGGFATANYFPPSDSGGVATISVLLVDGRDEILATCEIAITDGTTDPLLSVSVQTPPELAGLSMVVQYDPAQLDLPVGSVELLGEFAAGDCLSLIDDDPGRVEVLVTCPTLRPAAGADAARFFFENTGGTQTGLEGFVITCSGVDEQGRLLPTICRGRVTQI